MTWKDVVGYEGIYEVSDDGRVRTHKNKTTYSKRHGVRHWRQRELAQKIGADDCCRVNLWKNKRCKTYLVHRLVAFAFLEKPEGKDYINHIDGDRLNNNLENLEWCDHYENNNHAFDTGLIKTGSKVKLVNNETGEEHEFRSMQKASLYLGKCHSFIWNKLRKGNTEYENYSIKEM